MDRDTIYSGEEYLYSIFAGAVFARISVQRRQTLAVMGAIWLGLRQMVSRVNATSWQPLPSPRHSSTLGAGRAHARAVQVLKFQSMQRLDLKDRPVLRDPFESLREPRVRIDLIHLRGLHQRLEVAACGTNVFPTIRSFSPPGPIALYEAAQLQP